MRASEQPAPLPRETIVARLYQERVGPAHDGPIAWAADRESDADAEEEEEPANLLSLEDVLGALEGAGVPIDRSALPSKWQLQQLITLPQGGAKGSTQRARLAKTGAAMVRGIAAAVNPDGAGTSQLIAEALAPVAPLEERQRLAADRKVPEAIVASYREAKAKGLSKQEQRQRLSALVPMKGRQGYTRPMLNRVHGLNLSRCAADGRRGAGCCRPSAHANPGFDSRLTSQARVALRPIACVGLRERGHRGA